jgi:tetratricopeptide (TPR) repeat protein
MSESLRSILGTVLLVSLTGLAPADEPADPETAFQEALEHASHGRYERAFALMQRVRAANPDNPSVLWNLGLWSAELGRHREALAAWEAYRRVEPHDWHIRAKLIQTHQALGETELRDRERAELLKLRRESGNDEIRQLELYCREQFKVNGRRIMTFEHFEPSGPRRIFLRFSILDADGKEEYFYSLGSYDLTTQIGRQSGQITGDERLYHLDEYHDGYHATLLIFLRMPDYDKVRERVVAALRGELKPITSTGVRP